MPRVRKTQSGAPAQPIAPTTGGGYGSGVASAQLQSAMPTPAAVQTPAAAPAAAPAPQMSMEEAMAAAKAMSGGGPMMHAPTARPNEPITHGLPLGPGAGPEILGGVGQTKSGSVLRGLSQQTGNPYFADLANRMNL